MRIQVGIRVMRKEAESGEVLDLEVELLQRQTQKLGKVLLNLLKILQMILDRCIGADSKLDPSLRRREVAPGNVLRLLQQIPNLFGLLNLQLVDVPVSNLVIDLDVRFLRLRVIGLSFDRVIL